MILQSPFPDVEIPDISLHQLVLEKARKTGDKAALIDGTTGRTLTYADLVNQTQRVAFHLSQRGFGKGDCLAIHSPNLPEYVVVFLAVSSLGGFSTTANPLYTERELGNQLRDSQAKFLVTVPLLMDVAAKAMKGSSVREIFVFGEHEGATPFDDLLKSEGPLPRVELDPREDLVALPYSSGTTGLPKGVMLTHRNLVANLHQLAAMEGADSADMTIAFLPFFHIYGLVVILLHGLDRGSTMVTMPRFEMEQFLKVMQDYSITRAYLVPPIVLALAKHPLVDQYDLSKLEMIMSGAAPLGAQTTNDCAKRLGCRIKQGYGLTETSPGTHINPDDAVKDGSVGPLIPNVEGKVIDPGTGKALSFGQDGEICVRGPNIMKGYFKKPEDTAACVDPDGWFHTGDIGHVDEDGYFYIVDRLKELIKYKGYQIAPAELEAILVDHPAVADAAVIPSPDAEAGEVPKAFVVLAGEVSTDEILRYVAERVAPYKKIRHIEIVDQIPKSPSGKILRRMLVIQERQQQQQ